jgi:hypothetical protein
MNWVVDSRARPEIEFLKSLLKQVELMTHLLPCLVAVALWTSCLPVFIFAEEKPKLPPVNAKVLKFVESRLGEQVADGDCWKLADHALAAAKAKRPGRNGYGPYVFGRPLKSIHAALPGDVVQFVETEFVSAERGRYEMSRHTAVVAAVHGTKLEILHQNWNGRRRVSKLQLDFADLSTGQVTFYRPQAALR